MGTTAVGTTAAGTTAAGTAAAGTTAARRWRGSCRTSSLPAPSKSWLLPARRVAGRARSEGVPAAGPTAGAGPDPCRLLLHGPLPAAQLGGSLRAGAGGCGAAGTVLPAVPLPGCAGSRALPSASPAPSRVASLQVPTDPRLLAVPNSILPGPTAMPNSMPAHGNLQLDPSCAHGKSQLSPDRHLGISQHDPSWTHSNSQLDPGWSHGDTQKPPAPPSAFNSHCHRPWAWALFPSVEQKCHHGTGTGDTVRGTKRPPLPQIGSALQGFGWLRLSRLQQQNWGPCSPPHPPSVPALLCRFAE